MLTFYLLAGALTLIACLSVLLPFIGEDAGARQQPTDIDVYHAQLGEIDSDEARGLIGAKEAAEARAELGRRILRAAEDMPQKRAPATEGRWAVVAAIAAIPLLSAGIYLAAGASGLADQPLAARLQGNPGMNTIEELLARTERHLAANPDDGMGWSVIAPVYQRLGRHADAIRAWQRAIDLLGADAARLASLGEAISGADQGKVGEEARQHFREALRIEPGHEKSRFFLALGLAQDGDLDAAQREFAGLAEEGQSDSPWAELAAGALTQVQRMQAEAGQDSQAGEAGGSVAAGTESIDPQMIEAMVASLAERLARDPENPDGWERLIRSYIVLERRDEAVAALARAEAALAADSASLARLEALARELDLTGG